MINLKLLRPHWKCLNNLNDEDIVELKDYLEQWDKDYRTDVPFYCDDPRPEKFELTGFYPLYSDDENVRLDQAIDKLIETTDLFVPANKTCIGIDSNDLKLVNNNASECFIFNNEDYLLDVVSRVSNRKVNPN